MTVVSSTSRAGVSLPRPPAVSAWARACRLLRRAGAGDGALDRNPVGLYVSGGGEGGRSDAADPLSRLPGGRRRRRPGPSHFAGLGRWSRAAYATGTVGFCRKRARALSDHAVKSASEPQRRPVGLHSVPKRRTGSSTAGWRRCVAPAIQGFLGGCPPSSRGSIECPPSTACAVLRAARLLWAP